ncbi:MAG: phosphate ABC transporter permease PstA, partial [Ignavibacteriaceae bacterium]|nr:phosphate ABC transporter permease PstA [Ignavibacteriaceae bacterium]
LNLDFLLLAPSNNMTGGGIGPAIFGSFFLVVLMLILTVPLGFAAAIYLSEYKEGTLTGKILHSAINNLAGIPPVVLGLFGLGFLVSIVGRSLDTVLQTGLLFGKPILLWASVVLSILVLPTITITALQSLQAVPQNLRTAALSLGATKWETIRKVVIKQSLPGVTTGIILSISRGLGETAPIMFLGCAFFLPHLPLVDICIGNYCIPLVNPFEQFMALTYHIFILTTQSPNPTLTMPVQYASTLVLITLTLFFNLTAIIFRFKFRKSLSYKNL